MEPARLTDKPFWVGHIPFGFWIIDAFRPRRLVELGTETGVSFCAFNQAIVRFGVNCETFAVDTWAGDIQTGSYGDEILDELRRYHDPLYGHFARLVRTTFEEAVTRFDDGSIDLLHIDGCHTYEAVRADFETWKSKLSRRAVVLFHDVAVREATFGVHTFFDEVAALYPHFLFPHSNGLGVLAVGPDIDPAIEKLIEAGRNPDSRDAVRGYFARLGADFLRQVEARILASQVALREQAEQNSLRQSIAERDQRLSAELARRDDLELNVERLKLELKDARAELASKQGELADCRQQLAAELARRDENHLSLDRLTAALEGRLVELTAKQNELADARQQLAAELARRDERLLDIDRLNLALSTKQDELGQARQELAGELARRDERQLDLDRLKLDLTTKQNELAQARQSLAAELARRDERQLDLDRLHVELTDLRNQWGEQRQTIGSLATQIDDLRGRLAQEQQAKSDISQQLADTLAQTQAQIIGLDRSIRSAFSAIKTEFSYFDAEDLASSFGDLETADLTRQAEIVIDELAQLRRRFAELEIKADAEQRAESKQQAAVPQSRFSRRMQTLAWRLSGRGGLMPSHIAEAQALAAQGLMDLAYYSQAAGQVFTRIDQALRHYLDEGAARGFSPHPLFDVDFYAGLVGLADFNSYTPAGHWALIGRPRGLDPHPLFRMDHYVSQAGGEAASAPLSHYDRLGRLSALSPHPLFDPVLFDSAVTDLGLAHRGLGAYVSTPALFRLPVNKDFDAAHYLRAYPQVALRGINPLVHYVTIGDKSGFKPNPRFNPAGFRRDHAVPADRTALEMSQRAGP
jgi:hypothetical protein